MADNNPIKYSDLVKPDNSITELISQLDRLSDAYMNTLKNIKSEAITVKAALVGVSGATEQGRKAIKDAANDTDKLTRAAKDLAFAESETAIKLAELKDAQKDAATVAKLVAQRNKAVEGSYKYLSAQYSLNKIYLNNMTVEQREATEEGRKLVKETKAIYEEMKRLQEATGKTSLSVGDYELASGKLTSEIRTLTEKLALMRLEGKQNTAEYAEMSKRAGDLKDAMADASEEIKNMASDTSQLDTALGGLSAASGGFAAVTGAMQLFGGASEDVAEAQKKLQSVIAITTGVQAIQNAVQKQSALMLGISKIQMAALSKAQAYNRLVTMQGTKATLSATIAQKAFNLVAYANPYVLLAVALISVVGALVLFSSNTDKAAKKQQKLNEVEKAWLDYKESELELINRVSKERVADLERELNVAKARNASLEETRKIEDEILKERQKMHSNSQDQYKDEINNLDENRKRLEYLHQKLKDINVAKREGFKRVYFDIDFDGKVDTNTVDKAYENVQAQIDNYKKKIELATGIEEEGKNLESEIKILNEKRLQEDRNLQKSETQILNKAEDARIALVKNSFEQQRRQRTEATNRAITDIQYQLEYEANLTTRARKALNDQIVSLRQKLADDLVNIANQERASELSAIRKTQDVQISAMQEGAEKQRAILKTEYERQIEDLKIRLETEKGLTATQREQLTTQSILMEQQYAQEMAKLEDQITLDQLKRESDRIQLRLDAVREGSQEEIDLKIELMQKQREMELATNRQLAKDMQQSETEINAKYDAEILKQSATLSQQRALMLFDQQQALDASEFDLLQKSESAKTKFRLEQEKDRLEKILELNKQYGNLMTDTQVETMQNTIQKLDQDIKKAKAPQDLYDVFGLELSDEKKEAINESVNYALDSLNSYMDARVQAAEAAVESSNKEVESAQKRLDAEIEARNKGYASNVALAQKELDDAKKNQEKAIKNQQKAQKMQLALDSITQASSMVTASAKIWSQLGFPWAIPALAIMWGSFAASKIKAAQAIKQASSESYGEGTVELLQGGSHQSGNDIDMGTKPDGTRRRAEGGEFFAVINKRNSRKFRAIIPDVINSLNNGSFPEKYMAFRGGDVNVNVESEKRDLNELTNEVRAIKEQGERRIFVDTDGNKVEVYKNLTRKYK